MTVYFIERGLRSLFSRHGKLVAKYPLPFIAIPLVVSIALGLGILVSFTREHDPETLYGPRGSQSRQNRDVIEDIYRDVVDENMLTRHQTRIGYLGTVIITPHRGGDDVLTVPVITDVIRLHNIIMNVSVEHKGATYRFTDLCIMWQGSCVENDLLAILNYSAENVETTTLTYPLVHKPDGMVAFIGSQIGGVSFNMTTPSNEVNRVMKASALQLTYNLRYDTKEEAERGILWEKQFLQDVEDFQTDELTVDRFISNSISQELVKSSGITLTDVCLVSAVILCFSVLTTSMSDCVQTKPILACLGVFTAGLALVSTFGLLSYAGIPYITIAGSLPYLIMGIGVDDMFIIISAWRRTGTHLSTEIRVAKSLEESALSITITSLTDILAFSIGAISKFYSVTIFCLYASLAVLFAYVYMITFFAACLVLSGEREKRNRHALTLHKVLPKEESTSKAYSICCAGGVNPGKEKDSDGDNLSDTAIMTLMKTKYGPFLTHKVTVSLIVFLYLVYIALATWGVINTEEGIIMSNIPKDDSYLKRFYKSEKRFFRVYGPDMSIVAKDELQYWTPAVQDGIENVTMALEASDFFHHSSLTISWLRSYLRFLNQTGVTLNSKRTFIRTLREEFLTKPLYQQFVPDIVFDAATNESIISSRYYIIGKELATTTKQRDMFLKVRQILRRSPQYNLVAYHRAAPWILESLLSIRQNVITTCSIGIAAMLVISIVLIPNLVCAIINTISVTSTVFGTIGFMSICSITLDYISMVTIIIAIGFGIDYSAHMCYAFITAPAGNHRRRSIYALYSLGTPTLQGALSTLLAVSVLATSQSYIFRTFVQTMSLVIAIGTAHGMIFLPIFLMLLVPIKDNYDKVPSVQHQLQTM